MASIALRGVSRRFGPDAPALDGLDLSIPSGERLAVLGPSGSGKSTLLRLLAGLDRPTGGEIWFDGKQVDDVPAHRRDVGMVFQNPTLHPHLDVTGNVEFGLRARGVQRAERRRRVEEVAELLGLRDLLGRSPGTLSGGERQRAAIGRAIARRPAVLLLDEPFSSLDLPLRTALRRDLVELHERFRSTLIHVTHDQGEALALGERVAILDRGRLVQVGSPREVYDRPATPFAARFVGSPPMNLIPGEVSWADDGRARCILDSGKILGAAAEDTPPGLAVGERRRVLMGVRPEHLRIDTHDDPALAGSEGRLTATVRRTEDHGDALIVMLDVAGIPALARVEGGMVLAPGQRVAVAVLPGRVVWFPG
ncbi:ABC transporter ATP-binding protein [Paludisphaera soli]|uniref:ABC transporter ATP-binding protein n=1 Tax=Paludisphaera soli TaxID=2712865 RepID=UPI0013EC93B8|nr:ABC transporter ATP-binding protein [Paludisphaera soli]